MKGLLKLAAMVILACLLFLIIDVDHRMTGYQAVMGGKGIRGTVTVTSCEAHRTGTFCTGDFSTADGRVTSREVRINGAVEVLDWAAGDRLPGGAARIPAVLAEPGAGEAWTLDGKPWLRPSPVQVTALLPVVIVVYVLSGMLRGWRYRMMYRSRMRGRGGMVRREMAMARGARRGRVH